MTDAESADLEHDEETADLDRDERVEERVDENARNWWQRRRVGADERDEILGRMFYEGDRFRPYLFRFATLMALAVVIAVLGVVADSAALVIGAMLLAPLMTPVLALAAALTMIWPRRLSRAAIWVGLASVGAIALSWLVAMAVPGGQALALPNELLSRTRPTLLDLVVALAAGAAGGYSMVREEVGTSLPGVAVAVALVPPLAVVGAAVELGRTDLAQGALLLYGTNLAAIVFAAGTVFLATGFVPTVRVARLGGRVALAIAAALVPVVLLAIPLARSLRLASEESRVSAVVIEEVATWAGRDTRVTSVDVGLDSVLIALEGPVQPPEVDPLGDRLRERLADDLEVRVRWVATTEAVSSPD